ncbi:hypothetical protein VE25_19065 [Devosia geojensis]|uniref:Isocitrate dehydrogenase [NADP] n=1 Tax=Devosia geojensis TaxID=443610 RepID=A0A0F5FE07_9HYPH|nr:isocitrate/isopropylmalate family dehydrogenase [Devosia geojensis]KKB07139.1 hypothetical protein VE25_19065 [Devosia geojensis]
MSNVKSKAAKKTEGSIVPITVASSDGIGPEIMDASLKVLQAAGARLAVETIDIAEKLYLAGNTAGVTGDAWNSLRRTKVFYKAPIATPQGGGVKVWPEGLPETFCTDPWRCLFMMKPGRQFNKALIVDLLRNLAHAGVDSVKTEQLFTFDGEAAFSLGQGQ